MTKSSLTHFEAEISSARAAEPLPDGSLDFVHYKAVHHHLFQDVYEWAGQVRTVRISKGGNPFCFPENIEGQANQLRMSSMVLLCEPATATRTLPQLPQLAPQHLAGRCHRQGFS